MNKPVILRWPAFILAGLMLTLFSCDSDSDPLPEENPFFQLLQLPGTRVDTVVKAQKTWEYGFRFSTLREGHVTKLAIKVPRTGVFKVRLYQLNPDTLILEKELEAADAVSEHYLAIEELHLKTGGDFGLSIVADAFFKVKNADATALTFPVDQGSIRIQSFNEGACGADGCADFPDTVNSLVIAPCVSFVFKPGN